MFNPLDYLDELKTRLNNPSVLDSELEVYLISASRQVKDSSGWTKEDYDEMILNSACQLLLVDNKFPEISSIASSGVSTSFASGDPERFNKKISALRVANWVSS